MVAQVERRSRSPIVEIVSPSSQQVPREVRIQRLRSLARLMDEAITIPGTNISVGLDGLIGLVPVAGDILSVACSLYIVREAAQLGVPRHLIARMLWNTGIDFAGGIVPVAGDVFDVVWKANKKNMQLLENWFAKEQARQQPTAKNRRWSLLGNRSAAKEA